MEHTPLGRTGPTVSRIGLGTMTFGEQVSQDDAFAILDRALERGVTLIDTAEMYPVPTRRETYTATETIIGQWFAARPGVRQRVVLATKVAGPSRGMDWVRGGKNDLAAQDIASACHDSLRRLRTEVIDLYQIHWPNRNAPSFGAMYFDPTKDRDFTSIHDQLQALTALVRAGKVRHIDLVRHGHAMRIPVPGARADPALAALREARGRVLFAHADLAAYSVFEEAYTIGVQAAARVQRELRR